MVYLIVQILWFLVAAAAIGFAVGWLCSSATMSRRRETAAMQARSARGDLEAQREQLEARLAEATRARDALQEELAQVRQTAEADAKARRKLEREHSSAMVRLEARERELARPSAEPEGGRGGTGPPESGSRKPGGVPVSGSIVRQK